MAGLRVAVVGGGPVGSFCSYELAKSGCDVTWITGKDPKASAAYGSAGYVAVGLGSPLPSYESLGKVARWTLEKESPIRIQPGFLWKHLGWLLSYIRKGRTATSNEAVSMLREMGMESLRVIQELATSSTPDVEFSQNGALMVYLSQEKLSTHLHDLGRMKESKMHYRPLSSAECRTIEPGLSDSIAGGILFEDDGWVNPMKLLAEMRRVAVEKGVAVVGEEVSKVESGRASVTGLVVGDQRVEADQYVFAAGAFSQKLLGGLARLPVVPGWGHTITLATGALRIGRPVNFGDRRVALSQTASGNLRVSGFFELAPTDFDAPSERYEWLKRMASMVMPGIENLQTLEQWSGMRPCTPDGLPIIGRLPRLENAVVATGHCREGVTLAPAAARIVARIVTAGGETNPLISPSRFSS